MDKSASTRRLGKSPGRTTGGKRKRLGGNTPLEGPSAGFSALGTYSR